MYAVGVDVSNDWSAIAVLRSKTDIVIRPFKVTHNSRGFADKGSGKGGFPYKAVKNANLSSCTPFAISRQMC